MILCQIIGKHSRYKARDINKTITLQYVVTNSLRKKTGLEKKGTWETKRKMAKYSRVCYNERMLQRTFFINKIKMLQRTWRNTTGRRSTSVHMTCGAFPHWWERKSSYLLSFVRFSYQFSAVLCLFVQCIQVKLINFILFLHLYFWICFIFLLFKWLLWMITLL
jgi:hypothetical protein